MIDDDTFGLSKKGSAKKCEVFDVKFFFVKHWTVGHLW